MRIEGWASLFCMIGGGFVVAIGIKNADPMLLGEGVFLWSGFLLFEMLIIQDNIREMKK